jgi:ATP/maltotriose-dependent transcriptional regulator MalT
LSPVPAQRAWLQLVQGDVEAAARWTEARGVSCGDEPRHSCEPAYLVLARVLIAQGDTECARGLLDRLLESASEQHRAGSVIEIRVAQALARSAAGDESGALDALTEALVLGQDQEYVHLFASDGPPMAALFGALIAAQRSELRDGGALRLEYVARIAHALERQAGDNPDVAGRATFVPSLVTQLSEREVEVLRLLAAGEQNQQIADELYLALNTVKKHVTHIFEKLGVANRTEAAARARELGVFS